MVSLVLVICSVLCTLLAMLNVVVDEFCSRSGCYALQRYSTFLPRCFAVSCHPSKLTPSSVWLRRSFERTTKSATLTSWLVQSYTKPIGWSYRTKASLPRSNVLRRVKLWNCHQWFSFKLYWHTAAAAAMATFVNCAAKLLLLTKDVTSKFFA